MTRLLAISAASLSLFGCGAGDAAPSPEPYPAPDAWPANRGPGAPRTSFAEGALGQNCAYLHDGITSHHNLALMYDGYLLGPWAPEWGMGALSVWRFDDPCRPELVGVTSSPTMRETHAMGFSSQGGRWGVTAQLTGALVRDGGGIQFWDLSDVTAPTVVADLELPGFLYPDAYAHVVLSVFWQPPWVYVGAADLGIFVVDAADPRRPSVVGHYVPDPIARIGQVHAIGTLLVATTAEGADSLLLDISDPVVPRPVPGGRFEAVDHTGEAIDAYFSNVGGGYVWYTPKESGGGLIVMDIHDPSRPRYAGSVRDEGNGGYVFLHGRHAFVGESDFAAQYDISDPTRPVEVRRFDLPGDLDTATPVGNVVVLSVDDEGLEGQASAVAPFAVSPDTEPPRVTWAWPGDGATGVASTARLGLTLSEMVDVKSVFEGSVRLYRADRGPAGGRVPGTASAQENVINFSPESALAPATRYVLELPARGVVDPSGNAAEPYRLEFTTEP